MYASMFREGIFDGRTIVITGGGSGIGRCTAHELASLGAKVLITGRNAEKLERTAAEFDRTAAPPRTTSSTFATRNWFVRPWLTCWPITASSTAW